jgi:hypothetical protein
MAFNRHKPEIRRTWQGNGKNNHFLLLASRIFGEERQLPNESAKCCQTFLATAAGGVRQRSAA